MKDIKDYEGLYAITEDGKVWSYRSKKFLKPRKYNNYLGVVLCKNGIASPVLIHRLVAETYLPNPEALPCVNHKDENKHNNSLNNLEWCTRSYNACYGTAITRANKKKFKKVRCIQTGEIFESQKAAEEALGLWKGAIANYFHRNQEFINGYSFERIS